MSTKKYTNDLCGCRDCPECGVSDGSGWARFNLSAKNKRTLFFMTLMALLLMVIGMIANHTNDVPLTQQNVWIGASLVVGLVAASYFATVLHFSE